MKIIQITSVIVDGGLPSIIGLGDDGALYEWHHGKPAAAWAKRDQMPTRFLHSTNGNGSVEALEKAIGDGEEVEYTLGRTPGWVKIGTGRWPFLSEEFAYPPRTKSNEKATSDEEAVDQRRSIDKMDPTTVEAIRLYKE